MSRFLRYSTIPIVSNATLMLPQRYVAWFANGKVSTVKTLAAT